MENLIERRNIYTKGKKQSIQEIGKVKTFIWKYYKKGTNLPHQSFKI